MTETNPPQPERKKRVWCFCAGCLMIPVLMVSCLAAVYFLGPWLADEVLSELDTHKVESAVSIRPLDWRLQEKSGAVWVANGNGAAAETVYAQSDELIRESLLSGGNCTQLRRQQLETRARSLSDAGRSCRLDENCSKATYEEIGDAHQDVMARIQEIDSTGIAPFCSDP